MTTKSRLLPALSLGILLASLPARAETIDPNKPVSESLKPDLLYFNFDEEEDGYIVSQAESGLAASIETGKVDTPPAWKPGPGKAFGQALEFNYGSHPAFTGPNDSTAGNHLRIPDDPSLRLAGQSFTIGAWIQLPEGAELPPRPYKKIISKGGHSGSYPGWSLQISGRKGVWHLSLLLVGPDHVQIRGDARLPDLEPGAWQHVAASFDEDSKDLTLWVDGVPVYVGDAPAEVGESTLPLVIGENGMSIYNNMPLVVDEVFIVSGVHDFVPVNR